MAVLTQYFAAHCTFDVRVDEENIPAVIRFYKVPGPAHDALGSMMVSWGDGSESAVHCEADCADIETLLESPDAFPTASVVHTYGHTGVFHVRIGCASGFLPLAQLPDQTTAITAPLPTLTLGETDERGRLMPSDTLPPLVQCSASDAAPARTPLASVTANLLANNPDLAYFDRAFADSSLTELPAELFTPVKTIRSARELAAGSALTRVSAKLLTRVTTESTVEKAFADCPELTSVADPFFPTPVPACAEGLLAGAPLPLFAAFPRELRADLGCVRPPASERDQAFAFDWHARTQYAAEPIVLFYPMDFEAVGDLFIDWGDDTTQRCDWNTVPSLTHAYAKDGVYRVTLYSTPREPVRPFRLGRFVTKILSPLPVFYPRNVTEHGNFCGWAADARELTSVPATLFDAVGDTVTNLDEAFAGCTALTDVPDPLFTSVPEEASADGAFAFCKKLAKLPASYARRHRRLELDNFVPDFEGTDE